MESHSYGPLSITGRFRENTGPYCAVFAMLTHGRSALHR
jgi:hypothetical protein